MEHAALTVIVSNLYWNHSKFRLFVS